MDADDVVTVALQHAIDSARGAGPVWRHLARKAVIDPARLEPRVRALHEVVEWHYRAAVVCAGGHDPAGALLTLLTLEVVVERAERLLGDEVDRAA